MNEILRSDSVQPGLTRVSQALARAESFGIGALMVGIFGLLMLNVVSRSIGSPVIWVDEAAVYLMIWAALLGASLGLARREHLAVTLLPDMLSERARAALALAVDILLFVFFILFATILWLWFDPVTLWRSGSVAAFSRETFNFLYQEPTVTLGLRKLWFWLILPVFCFNGLIHSLAHLTGPRGGIA
ncbi:MAG: TRAP transporter small permease subunit [Maritimibacter sp.]|nr:TRAP transporter small permease subunit [Maritimibacter sp.]